MKYLVINFFTIAYLTTFGQASKNGDSRSYSDSLRHDPQFAELIFNGMRQDSFIVSRTWLSHLDSIVLMSPDYKIISFRVSSCCEKAEYSEFASRSNKLTKEMKEMFGKSPIPCEFVFSMFLIEDMQGDTIKPEYLNYKINLRK